MHICNVSLLYISTQTHAHIKRNVSSTPVITKVNFRLRLLTLTGVCEVHFQSKWLELQSRTQPGCSHAFKSTALEAELRLVVSWLGKGSLECHKSELWELQNRRHTLPRAHRTHIKLSDTENTFRKRFGTSGYNDMHAKTNTAHRIPGKTEQSEPPEDDPD